MGGAYRPPPPPTRYANDPYGGPTTYAYGQSGQPVPTQNVTPFFPQGNSAPVQGQRASGGTDHSSYVAPDMPSSQQQPLPQNVQNFLNPTGTPVYNQYHTMNPPAGYQPPPPTQPQQQLPPPSNVRAPDGTPIYNQYSSTQQ
jgi:hypothetical protein